MLAVALMFALTAHSALAKPTGNCFFMCESQPGFIATSGAYTQPGFTHGNILGVGSVFGSGATHGNIEDFGTVPVYHQPATATVYRPAYGFAQQTVEQQPQQPQIDGMFTHSSSKSSFESNNGYVKIHQPAVSRTVVHEPIRVMPRPRPARICENIYDPCA